MTSEKGMALCVFMSVSEYERALEWWLVGSGDSQGFLPSYVSPSL